MIAAQHRILYLGLIEIDNYMENELSLNINMHDRIIQKQLTHIEINAADCFESMVV